MNSITRSRASPPFVSKPVEGYLDYFSVVRDFKHASLNVPGPFSEKKKKRNNYQVISKKNSYFKILMHNVLRNIFSCKYQQMFCLKSI